MDKEINYQLDQLIDGHTHEKKSTQINRQTYGQTNRLTDKQKQHRQTDKQMNRNIKIIYQQMNRQTYEHMENVNRKTN